MLGLRVLTLAWRSEARLLATRLGPALILQALLISQLSFIVDWPGLWAWSAAASPAFVGTSLASLTVLHALGTRRGLHGSLFGSRWTWLRRQPLLPRTFTPAAVSLALAWAAPALILLALVRPDPAVVGVGTVGLVLGGIVAGARTWTGLGALLPIAVATGLLAALAQAAPFAAVLAAPALLAAGPLHRALDRPLAEPTPVLPGRPRSAFTALFRRDLLALLRTTPDLPWVALLPAVPVSALLLAMTQHPWEPVDRARAAVVLLLAAAPGATWALIRVRTAQGTTFDPARWPVRPRLRVAALLATALIPLTPTWAAAAVSADLAPHGHAWLGGTTVALAAVAVLAITGPRTDRVVGPALWATGLVMLATLLDPVPPVAALTLTAGMLAWSTHRLARRRGRP